jgi:hypothetical protein
VSFVNCETQIEKECLQVNPQTYVQPGYSYSIPDGVAPPPIQQSEARCSAGIRAAKKELKSAKATKKRQRKALKAEDKMRTEMAFARKLALDTYREIADNDDLSPAARIMAADALLKWGRAK